jgi:hypothetical protein
MHACCRLSPFKATVETNSTRALSDEKNWRRIFFFSVVLSLPVRESASIPASLNRCLL